MNIRLRVLLPVITVLVMTPLLLGSRKAREESRESAPEVIAEADPALESSFAVEPLEPREQTTAPRLTPVKLSFGVDEIVKLHQTGVPDEVILTYIDTSTVAYYPGADEIAYLNQVGLSPGIIQALMRHGARLRDQTAKEAKELQAKLEQRPSSTASTYTQPSIQPATYSPQPVQVNYVYPAVSPIPIRTYPRAYSPPVYYGYSFARPISHRYPSVFQGAYHFPRYHRYRSDVLWAHPGFIRYPVKTYNRGGCW